MNKFLTVTALCGALVFSTPLYAAETWLVDVSTVLTVRAEPDAGAQSVGSLGRNAPVRVLRFLGTKQTLAGRTGHWAEIAYGNTVAYVFGGFLKTAGATSTNTNTANNSDTQPASPRSGGHASVLAMLQDKYPAYYAHGVFLVDDSEQRMYRYAGGQLLHTYRISTAAKGLGSGAESEKTPSGAHRISTKIGSTAKRGAIFDKLQNTGQIAKIYTKPAPGVKALVTSRILRLDGLELGKNKGGNVDTFNRAIYFHGTNKEGNLGSHASHGCIRMNNDEIIDLFSQVSVDTLVYIQP